MWSFKNWERCSLLTITCSACVSVILFVSFRSLDREKNLKTETQKTYSLQAEKMTDDKCISVCDSRNCIVQADMLLRSIKPSTDPCENFQEFLCGSYEEKFSRDEGNTLFNDMTFIMYNKLKDLLENIEAEPGTAASKLKIFYDSCVNLGSSELRGVEDIRQVLNDVEILNWPYLAPDFEFSDGGLPVLLATFRSNLQIKFLGFTISSASGNDVNSNDTYVKIDFNHRSFNNIPVIQKEDATDILKYFDMKPEDIDTLLNDLEVVRNALLKFGKDGTVYLDKCKGSCPDIHIDCSEPIEGVQAHICDMVEVYLNETKLKSYVKTSKITIEKDYAFHVINLIPRLKSLSDRSVANFFAFNLLWNNLSEVNLFFRLKMKKYFKYFAVVKNQKTTIGDKWEHCLAYIIGSMKLILENELVKSLFTKPYIEEVHDIHQWHTSAISKMIDYQEWITPHGKRTVKNHIKYLECNMDFVKGRLPNDTYVNEFLKIFNPNRASFLQNILEYKKTWLNALSRLELTHFRKSELKFEAGAFTNHEDEITFYYGLLMPPVYYPGHEKFINMIVFAPMVGHEIGHNVITVLNLISQYSSIIKKNFFERKHCIDKQFSNFKFRILGENLYGPRYFDENISDNLGYAATDKMIDELELSEEDFFLPGLPYSSKQLLYMSSRQIFCSKDSQEMEVYFNTTEGHAPSEYRIIASGQNSKGYSKAFNCPEGSYMNPTEKCTLLDSV